MAILVAFVGLASRALARGPSNPAPTLYSVFPGTAHQGGPSYTLQVFGLNFLPTSTVKWNNKGLPTTFISATELEAAVGSQFLHDAGNVDVTVTSPKPGGGVTSPQTVFVSNDAPILYSVFPPTADQCGPTYTLQVFGTNFYPLSVVKWNGKSLATTYVSFTELEATVTPGFLITPGNIPITVTNPAGGGSSSAQTVVVAHFPPTLYAVWPATAALDGTTYTLSVFGTNFYPLSVVKWNGKSLPTTYVSYNQLQATVGAQFLHNAGNIPITVTNPAGGGLSGAQTVVVAPPAVARP
jgi:hypothetical protein